jgi:hypothetical protein
LIYIVDISEASAADRSKKITLGNLFVGIPAGAVATPSIAAQGDQNTGIWFPAADTIAISVGGSQSLTVDSSGNCLIGKTSYGGSATGIDLGKNGFFGAYSPDSTSSTTGVAMYSNGASAYRFYVDWAGTIFATNTTISAISDQRFKENIRDLDVGLDAIMALKPRKFDWKAGKGADKKDARGFIAQEFEQVFPDLIDEWKDPAPEGEAPYKSVRQDLIPVLVKAIQEQQAIMNDLRASMAQLEAKVTALEAR